MARYGRKLSLVRQRRKVKRANIDVQAEGMKMKRTI
ncbi:hypothetical protein BN437_3177 [Erwinia amylovora NBRC 12687 = CFBP 1232]|uniref:Uncharacterized protein n=2 Tax=Erwinia amylovora TaxID=552 RepID=A0A831EUN1_ERWAM|nr:hypothetical protein predicted by Glimmer/Critica [Erwinia amylovora ATCC BAA-2158]CCO95083.1 hypothetical protein BN437_3177 [Erwinia amylovora NBRC 12687 = CFBP 1232]